MTEFETQLRQQINDAPASSPARNLFKVVLGEWQNKTSLGKATDEIGHNIVRKMIKANEENLGYLSEDDPRTAQYKEENEILKVLMPSFLSDEQIKDHLDGIGDQHPAAMIRAAKSDGQAMGVAMKYFKLKGLSVEGGVVKQVVSQIRA